MPPLGLRKQPSGAEKRRRRKKIQEFVKSQANAILKYLKKPEESTIHETISTQSNVKLENVNDEVVHEQKKKEHLSEDMSDPVNWRNVDKRLRDSLAENGPATRLSSDYRFPKNATGRHFSHAFYIRDLVNGEKVDRQWLVYSKSSDKVFCFCCKLFREDLGNGCGGNLATTGYNDWRNLSATLKDHERRPDHMLCFTRWKLGKSYDYEKVKHLIS